MEPPSDGVVIYTIGHSNGLASQLVALLQKYEIEVLVDVRSAPYSQYTPQFNREALKQTLLRPGIEYRFAGEHLGGRPADPTCYRAGQVPDGKADYLHLVDYDEVRRRPWYEQAIAELMEVASRRRTALMCSEEDPSQCHRHHLIAQTLLERGVTVLHIRGHGGTENAKQLRRLAGRGDPAFQQQTLPF